MDPSINFDGKKYISARLAAENLGYTSDYIGQLCRSKKVAAQLVGRSWYVLESDIVEYKKNSHPDLNFTKNVSKKIKSNAKSKKNRSVTSAKPISKDTKILRSEISISNNNFIEAQDNFSVSYKTKENIAKIESSSRSSEILSINPKYSYEESELFPNLTKKIDLPRLKYSAFEGLENSISKPKIKSKFEKLTVNLTLSALFLAFLGAINFGDVNLNALTKLPFDGARQEVAILYEPFFNSLKNDYTNQKKYLENPNWQFDQLVAASFVSVDPLNSVFRWAKNTAYKIAKPWLSDDPSILVENKATENNSNPGTLFSPSSSVVVDQSPKTIVQSKTVYIPSSDREYLDLRIEEKFAEIKNYFLVNPLAPNVNRYYVTRQNDVIASSIRSSSSSGSSGSSGVSTFLELTDTQSSFVTNRIVHTNSGGTALTDTAGFVFDGSNLGIGTTTPYAPLSVVGQIVGAYFTGTTTATSTFGGNLSINGTGTTTSNGGFNISAGCFSINNTCVGGGAGSGASTTLLADSNTWSGANNFTSSLALSSTTPFARLSVDTTSLGAGVNSFVVGSSTRTDLIVTQAGYVGVGTALPSQKLEVVGNIAGTRIAVGPSSASKLSTVTEPAALLYGSNVTTNNNGIVNIVSTDAATIDYGGSIALGGQADSERTFARIGGFKENSTGSDYAGYFALQTRPSGTALVERLRVTSEGNMGIGTTTPFYRLTVASSTALSDGAGVAQWVQRNAGGNLYFATTTVAGTSTTTTSALSIIGSNGKVGIGTDNPQAGLDVVTDGGTINQIRLGDRAGRNLYLSVDTANSYIENPTGSLVFFSTPGQTTLELDHSNNVIVPLANGGGKVIIGTSTASYLTTIASSTAPQLALSAGTGLSQITFRNAGGNFYISSTTVAGTATTSTSMLEISGSGFGTTTLRGLNISGQATSTSNVGINLSGGCFSINNTCVGGSSSGASTTLLADSNTWSGANNFTSSLALSSTTPFARLSVDTTSLGAGVPSFVVGSSTRTDLIVTQAGNVGIGTAAPIFTLDIPSGSTRSGSFYANGTGSAGSPKYAFYPDTNTGMFSGGTDILSFATNGTEKLTINASGSVGIGTTTPFTQLQIATTSSNGGFKPQFTLTDMSGGTNLKHWNLSSLGGNFYLGTSTDLYSTTSISALEIAGSGFGTTTVRGLNISGQATSTSNVGINLSGGCFSINNTCVGGSSSGASTTLLADSNTWSGANNFTSSLALSSTTPFARLSVDTTSLGAGVNSFVVGSSTRTDLIVTQAGNVGIGVSNPQFALDISSNYGTTPLGVKLNTTGGALTTATMSDANGYVGVFGVSSTNSFTIGSYTGLGLSLYSNNDYANPKLFITSGGNVGIGTTTAAYRLTVASSTALTDGAGIAQWVTRNAGGNLYFATTTVAGTATSSLAALTIDGTTGRVGIATTTSGAMLGVENLGTTAGFIVSDQSNDASPFIIDASGNVGIGQPSLSLKLQVLSDEAEDTVRISNSNASGYASIHWDNDSSNEFYTGVGGSSTVGTFANKWYTYTPGGTLSLDTVGLMQWSGTQASIGVSTKTITDVNDVMYMETSNGYTQFHMVNPDGANTDLSAFFSVNTTGNAAFGTGDTNPGLQVWTQSAHPLRFATNATERMRISSTGSVGISTTTPYYNLTIASTTAPQLALSAGTGIAQWVQRNAGGNFYLSTTTVAGTATTSISALEISGSGFGTTTLRGLNISGQATSTSNVGINLSGGCFSINNTCVGGSSSGASTTLLADSNTWSGANNFTSSLALSSTTPFARLSVDTTSLAAGVPSFVVGSSTRTDLIVTQAGNVGIGTASPTSQLHLYSNSNNGITIENTSGSNPSTSLTLNNSGRSVNWSMTNAGNSSDQLIYYMNGNKTLQIATDGKTTVGFNSGLGSSVFNVQGNQSIGSNYYATAAPTNGLIVEGNVGFSTSTPYYNLTVASTTGAQLSLSAGTGIAQWVTRNAGGNLYFATTTVAGTSTSTLSAFTILGSNGRVGIATTTPNATLALQGAVGTHDLFQVASSTGAAVFKISNYGGLIQTLSSTTAISVQDSSGNAVFAVDTTQTTGSGLDITASGGQTANLFNIYQSDGSTNYLAVGPSGNFGIGTGTPSHLFTVATSTTTKEPVFDIYHNSSGATSTVGFFVSTTTGSAAGVGLGLPSALANYMIVGNGKVQAGMAIVNGGLCIDNDGWCTASTTGRISSVTSTTGGSDVAEMYNSEQSLEPGDVVAITEPRNFVKLANGVVGDVALGIVSTEPGVVLGLQPDDNDKRGIIKDVETDGAESTQGSNINEKTVNKYPIALAGRVPIKVSVENGEIKPGDYVTLSTTTPGVSMKATMAGNVLGQALEGYSESAPGKILIFVKNTYYPGPGSILVVSADQDLATTTESVLESSLGEKILKFFENLGLKVVDGIAYMKNLFVEKLTVGTRENPSGITIYDEVTGDPYCLKIVNGAMASVAGECVTVIKEVVDNGGGNGDGEVATTTDPIIGEENATSTPPVIEETPIDTSTSTPEVLPTVTDVPVQESEEPVVINPEPAPLPVPEPVPTN